jgi:hypothetical protein
LFETLTKVNRLRQGVLDGSLPELTFFSKQVLPLVEALQQGIGSPQQPFRGNTLRSWTVFTVKSRNSIRHQEVKPKECSGGARWASTPRWCSDRHLPPPLRDRRKGGRRKKNMQKQ